MDSTTSHVARAATTNNIIPTLDEYFASYLHGASPHEDEIRCPICWGAWDYPSKEVVETSPECRHRFHKECLLKSFAIKGQGTDDEHAETTFCPVCRRVLFQVGPSQFRPTVSFLTTWIDGLEARPLLGMILVLAFQHSVLGNQQPTKPWASTFMLDAECADALTSLFYRAWEACKAGVLPERCPSPSAVICCMLTIFMRKHSLHLSPMGWSRLGRSRRTHFRLATQLEKNFLQDDSVVRYEIKLENVFKGDVPENVSINDCGELREARRPRAEVEQIVYKDVEGEGKSIVTEDRIVVEDSLPGWLEFLEVDEEKRFVFVGKPTPTSEVEIREI